MNLLDFREIGVFNSREIAIAVCTATLLTYCLYHKSIRASIISLLKAMFAKQFAILYLLLTIYSLLPILVFVKLGFWRIELTKEVTFWILFSALPTLFNINKADKDFFVKSLLDNIKFTVIIEFITSQYTFNIFLEIIIIILSVLAGGIIAHSNKKEEFRDANRFTKIIIYSVGIFIFVFSFYKFFVNISGIWTIDKLEEFSLPIVLGIWFVPFLYFTHLYTVYESVFLGMKYAIKDKEIYSYAKKRSFIYFLFNTKSLKRWKDSLFISEVKSKEDVLISLLEIRRLELVERNPPKIDIIEGWSPYESKNFLSSKGINTNHYKRCYDNEWQAASNYIKLNEEIIDNNIAYYVSGNDKAVTQLKIVLNVYSSTEESLALNKYIECIKDLYKAAFGESIPMSLNQNNIKVLIKSFSNLRKDISFNKIAHQSKLKGYTLSFAITNKL